MLRTFTLQITLILLLVLPPPPVTARDFIIYSVTQELSMGFDERIPQKNYYVNLGGNQGAVPGVTLDVFRIISRMDQHTSKKRHNHQVKVGELEVLHSEEESSIAKLKQISAGKDTPLFEIDGLMIGDFVSVNVK